jgi:hypothetical protein
MEGDARVRAVRAVKAVEAIFERYVNIWFLFYDLEYGSNI